VKNSNIKPDIEAYDTILGIFGENGNMDGMLQICNKIISDGMKFSEYTYITLIKHLGW
jgi:pentatricopeptide repeat protein